VRKRFTVLLLAAAVLPGTGALVQARSNVGALGNAASSGASQSAPTSTIRTAGTIETYETPTRTLTLSTPNGTVRLAVALAARIRWDGRRMNASDLEKLHGHYAVVRYSQSEGNRTVESVHVFGKERTDR
jgi:hypothetical protein